MKRIAIFCDGTWNRSDATNPTNVVLLAQAVKPTADDGTKQVTIYLPGVGSGKGVGRISQRADRILGGILGQGLLQNIREAYRALIFMYEPGDEIFIFGFSRGAYTARSLAGLLRKAGILPPDKVGQINDAIALYRKRGAENHPDAPHIQAERMGLSPRVATSQKDCDARGGDVPILKITYLGVWDTVGALGVPTVLSHIGLPKKLIAWWNRRHAFHDTELSSSVAAARHAVSIDEVRATFPPALWENLDPSAEHKGLNDPDREKQGKPKLYQQLWFAGDHGSVGGGGDIKGLSNIALRWIAEGADQAKLDLVPGPLTFEPSPDDICAPVLNMKKISILGRILRIVKRPRDQLTDADAVAEPVVERLRFLPDSAYRPPTLEPVWDALQERVRSLPLTPPKSPGG